jgi:hypothetical protein
VNALFVTRTGITLSSELVHHALKNFARKTGVLSKATNYHKTQITDLQEHTTRKKTPSNLLPSCTTHLPLTPNLLYQWHNTLHLTGLSLTKIAIEHHQTSLKKILNRIIKHTNNTAIHLRDKQAALQLVS